MSSLENNKYTTDQQWVKEIAEGNEAAFEMLFYEFYYKLCNIAYSIVKSRSRARDVVQDVFFKIWKRKADWKVQTSLKVYLYQAVRNEALNSEKKEKAHRRLKDQFSHSVILREEVYEEVPAKEEKELVNKIWQIVTRMPDRRRLVFVLHRKHGLSYKEISRVMDIARKTVENHMGEALKDIREQLLEMTSRP